MRGEMLEVLGQDYIRTAKAKGLSERKVNYKHALRNAIIIIIATIGGILPGLISGAGKCGVRGAVARYHAALYPLHLQPGRLRDHGVFNNFDYFFDDR